MSESHTMEPEQKSSNHATRRESIAMTPEPTEHQFVLCIRNDDSEDLERRKVYQVIPDAESEKEGYISRNR